MLELGDASEKQHAEVGNKCSSLKIDIVFTIGEQAVFTDSNIIGETSQTFKSKENLIKTLIKIIEKMIRFFSRIKKHGDG